MKSTVPITRRTALPLVSATAAAVALAVCSAAGAAPRLGGSAAGPDALELVEAAPPLPALVPPANDAFASATVVPGLPFSAVVDTREATSAPDDPSCAGEDAASVWFAYTPIATTWLVADTFGSDYDTTLSAYAGTPGGLVQVACNDDATGLQSQIAFLAEGGVTYHLMAAGLAQGGLLELTLDVRTPLAQRPVRTTSAYEITPSAGDALAWAQAGPRSRYWTLYLEEPGKRRVRANAARTHGFSGGFDDSRRFVFQQVSGRRSDLVLFGLDSRRRSSPPGVNTRNWEWHPTMTDDWLLFGRRNFRTRVDQIVLQNRNTRKSVLLDRLTRAGDSRIAEAGQVNGGFAVWDRCVRRCDVFVRDIAARTTTRVPNPGGRQQYAPAVSADGTVYFVRSGRGCGTSVRIVRRPLGGPSTTLVSLGSGLDTFHTFAADHDGGAVSLYYERIRCRGGRSDIYRIVDP